MEAPATGADVQLDVAARQLAILASQEGPAKIGAWSPPATAWEDHSQGVAPVVDQLAVPALLPGGRESGLGRLGRSSQGRP